MQDPEVQDMYSERFGAVADEAIPDEGLLSELSPEDSPTEEGTLVEEGEELLEGEDTDEDEGFDESTEETVQPKVYKVGGRELTADQITQEGLLDDLVTQASQVAHYQQLYEQARTQPAPQVQPQPAVDPRQLPAMLHQQLNQAVQEGFFEPEFVQFYPQVAAAQLFVYQDYIQLRNVVQSIAQDVYQRRASEDFATVKNNFSTSCQGLTRKHEVYSKLSDRNEQDRFWDFLLTKVNPQVGAINPDFLARQYLAYKQDGVLEAVKTRTGVGNKSRKKKRRLATGEGGSPRAGQRVPAKTDDEAVIDAMIGAFSDMA